MSRRNAVKQNRQPEMREHTTGSSTEANGPGVAVKGNNGKSAERQYWRRLLMGLPIIPIVAFFFVNRYFHENYHVDTNIDNLDYSYKRVYHKRDSHKNIIENYLTLINLSYPDDTALSSPRPGINRYGRVQASFCEIDWSKQSEDPTTVPMFRDLQHASPECKETYTVVGDFHQLVQQAKAFDGFDEETQQAKHKGIVFPPTGAVFHQTRCGSTLFANLLSAFAPGQSRVYSESRPPMNVFRASTMMTPTSVVGNSEDYDDELHRMLIRDTFYMMGRRPPPKNGEEDPRLFFKFQSVGVFTIEKFTMAFPDVPWVFVFRETVEIMQSLLRQGAKMSPKVCTRYRRFGFRGQAPSVRKVINHSGKPFEELTPIQYCAAHVGGLALAAVNEYDRSINDSSRTTMGRFVEYTQMPDIVWKDILPNHFGVKSMPQDAITKMEKIAGTYSKGRGAQNQKEWEEDSTAKQLSATPAVIQASNLMVSKVYKRMKELSTW